MFPAIPKLSLVVPVCGKRRQVERTLHTLSVPYQRNVIAEDYEVVIVESPAPEIVGAERVLESGGNVRHARVDGEHLSDQPAIALGYELSRAPLIGFLGVGGMATPRVVEHVMQACHLVAEPLIVVPSYDLALPQALFDDCEQLLERFDWKTDGYELFTKARFGRENANGYLCGVVESQCFFCTRASYERARASSSQGSWTHDALYAALISIPDIRLIVLGGEAYVHQEPRDAQPKNLWWRPEREPVLFGAIPGQARGMFELAIGGAAIHCALTREQGRQEWANDRRAPLIEPSGELPTASPLHDKPSVSIVMVVFRMRRQAENTIYSLTPRHQWNVRAQDYEIIVIENNSSENLGRDAAIALGDNIRYFARDERGVSPAAALNFGVSQARADVVGLMIDGARMVTPRVLENVLMALRVHARPLVVVPGYHLGSERQFVTSQAGYDEAFEEELLSSVGWKQAGHRLFEVSSFDDTTLQGFMNPLLESTCLFCPRACFDAVGGVDERFDLPGGGIANLDLFERLCRLEGTKLVVLWAEGAFHQYHGGTSSRNVQDREAMLESFRSQYEKIRGRPYATWDREPQLLGSYVGPAHELLVESAKLGKMRFSMVRDWGRVEWPND